MAHNFEHVSSRTENMSKPDNLAASLTINTREDLNLYKQLAATNGMSDTTALGRIDIMDGGNVVNNSSSADCSRLGQGGTDGSGGVEARRKAAEQSDRYVAPTTGTAGGEQHKQGGGKDVAAPSTEGATRGSDNGPTDNKQNEGPTRGSDGGPNQTRPSCGDLPTKDPGPLLREPITLRDKPYEPIYRPVPRLEPVCKPDDPFHESPRPITIWNEPYEPIYRPVPRLEPVCRPEDPFYENPLYKPTWDEPYRPIPGLEKPYCEPEFPVSELPNRIAMVDWPNEFVPNQPDGSMQVVDKDGVKTYWPNGSVNVRNFDGTGYAYNPGGQPEYKHWGPKSEDNYEEALVLKKRDLADLQQELRKLMENPIELGQDPSWKWQLMKDSV